ncbi:MBL fold metallo-hydrolase [Streptomyces sp. SPB162]|uniref:MBL fold metallo-hydrolase n=1 Tax=Streptomyces sp. SPB162 TaxID=2940560 RepID=UPI00240713F7|nr:MBL fold metallo-hydrolase [Streptomyces sp. SPB162]MDF9812001.1 hydroxyacylglutathione hydrolase [Streptomyces sp. SPB162]
MDEFSGPPAGPGDLDVRWHAGWPSAKHDPAPEIQVHAFDENTLILRQNMSVHFEAPFVFLLLGADRALLVDTGATADERYFPLRRTVDALIEDRLVRRPRPGYGLLVAHTHGHGDHIAADGQFAGRPDTTVVGTGLADVTAFFGLTGWPDTRGALDLGGGRIVDVIPGPGHQEAAVVLYDRATGLLLTGDSFYPGMLYVQDTAAFTATVDRLLEFCATRPVTHILGCHVEMTTTPGEAYPRGTTYQPDEPPLQLGVDGLTALRKALTETGGRRGAHIFDNFIVDITG